MVDRKICCDNGYIGEHHFCTQAGCEVNVPPVFTRCENHKGEGQLNSAANGDECGACIAEGCSANWKFLYHGVVGRLVTALKMLNNGKCTVGDNGIADGPLEVPCSFCREAREALRAGERAMAL